MELTPALASRFARIALLHVTREFPNKLDHVMDSDRDALTPRMLHPVFYGSFDWHSCVHSWWMLIRLRRQFPDLPEAEPIRKLAYDTITPEGVAAELAYARRPASRGFERPYGWAWLFTLAEEAHRAPDPLPDMRASTVMGPNWAHELSPLAFHFAKLMPDYLAKLEYPITTGTHANTAFALTLTLPYADRVGGNLKHLVRDYARAKFGDLGEYRGWEPGGDEFLSPVLSVALLMSKVLPQDEFAAWFARVLPEGGWIESLCRPVTVTDPTDGKMAHLDGVNFSRAWALRGNAKCLPQGSRTQAMRALADEHFAASIEAVDGDYMGSHWLASFALLAALEA